MNANEEIFVKSVNMKGDASTSKENLAFLKGARAAAIEGMEKTASLQGPSVGQAPYPTPFINLSDLQIPRSTNEIFKLCKYFYTFDPLISGAINALANFPITEVYFEDIEDFEQENAADGEDDKTRESETCRLYKKIFFKKINIYKLLVEIGIDYWLYGNCFIYGTFTNSEDKRKREWASMRRLDPSMIIIDHNPVTQEKIYKWRVPAKIVNIVRKKSPKSEYDKIPPEVRAAVEKKGAVILNPKNVYHFSRPTDSMGDNSIWGTPVIANVLKLLMYRNVLRQAQEAIAREHIVPFRVYYLQSTENANMNVDWNDTAADFSRELMKSVRDPNHKVVSPVPVGLLNVGGEGRALLLTPEIEQCQGEILAGMNVPREFLFGGVSYSGSSVSLKILENQFITYRLLMEDFVSNFCIKRLAQVRGDWVNEEDDDNLITVKFNDLKMQDDVQQKQIIIGLNASGKVSDTYLLKMMSLEPDKIQKQLDSEEKQRLKTKFEMTKLEAKYEFELKKQQIIYAARLQRYEMLVNAAFGVSGMDPSMPIPEEEVAAPEEYTPDGQPVEQQATMGSQMAPPIPQKQDSAIPQQNDIASLQRVAMELDRMEPAARESFMSKLPEVTRQQLAEVYATVHNKDIDMRPMPEQLPPRRNSLK